MCAVNIIKGLCGEEGSASQQVGTQQHTRRGSSVARIIAHTSATRPCIYTRFARAFAKNNKRLIYYTHRYILCAKRFAGFGLTTYYIYKSRRFNWGIYIIWINFNSASLSSKFIFYNLMNSYIVYNRFPTINFFRISKIISRCISVFFLLYLFCIENKKKGMKRWKNI